ncbi:MAG: nickel pincer cofactor biosynthesis protein LarC [Promethearchaeota archaeon]
MKSLYIDASNSGISGDMFLASLLGLVSESNNILKEIIELKNYLPGVSKLNISLKLSERSGIQVNQLRIDIKENKNHRTAKILKSTLNKFLDEKIFSDFASDYANRVLNSLIQAEAEVHGKMANKIHLHELSSVDTLIDILGVTKVLDILDVFKKSFIIYCSKLPLGGGTINAAHGILPIPAPATVKILEKSNLLIEGGPIDAELVTPTGAALLVNLHPKILPYPNSTKLIKIVYGAGQKKFKNFLNTMRLFYGEDKELIISDEKHYLEKYIEKTTVLETAVDDISGEVIGNFVKNMESENILDLQIIPSITKKNRPGHVIKILCHPEYKYEVIEKIIEELGTLGVRFNTITRICINRKIEKKKIKIKNKMYELRYKISFIESENGKKIVNIKPEYEDLKIISEESGISINKIKYFAQAQITQNMTF